MSQNTLEKVGVTREERLADLASKVEAADANAKAFRALADLIDSLEVPVSQYGPIWKDVAGRLRSDARKAEVAGSRAHDRWRDLAAAVIARERFVEAEPTTNGHAEDEQ